MRDVISTVPVADKIILLGDFNARVGGDFDTWSEVLRKFGRGSHNSNGELLLSICTKLDLEITNTYSQQPTTTTTYGSILGPKELISLTILSQDIDISRTPR